MSVSTTFFASATNLDPQAPDVILVSSDSVYFHVHRHRLLRASRNYFNFLLKDPTVEVQSGDGELLHGEVLAAVCCISETAPLLNVLLHAIYEISCAPYQPPLELLSAAIRTMPKYGIDPRLHLAPSTALFSLILARAPIAALEAYALAAEHGAYELAVGVSPHLLSCDLSNVTEPLARRIGPVYLRRLFALHMDRVNTLKRLLLPAPLPHGESTPGSKGCDAEKRKNLARAWDLAAAYLAWVAKPGGCGLLSERSCTFPSSSSSSTTGRKAVADDLLVLTQYLPSRWHNIRRSPRHRSRLIDEYDRVCIGTNGLSPQVQRVSAGSGCEDKAAHCAMVSR